MRDVITWEGSVNWQNNLVPQLLLEAVHLDVDNWQTMTQLLHLGGQDAQILQLVLPLVHEGDVGHIGPDGLEN